MQSAVQQVESAYLLLMGYLTAGECPDSQNVRGKPPNSVPKGPFFAERVAIPDTE